MVNALIKTNNLLKEIKKKGISRVSGSSISLIDNSVNEYLGRLINLMKEEMLVNGRKTITEDDVKNALVRLKKEENYLEI